MDTIHIHKLILDGVHGLTEKERNLPQRFRVDVSMTGFSKAHHRDSISEAVDYRIARGIATEVVQNQSYLLLETIAHKIADEILRNTIAASVVVAVQKLGIWGNGIPGVSVTKEKVPAHIDLLNFDLEDIVNQLSSEGGVSFPIIPENRRIKLLEEAYSYHYNIQPEVVGKARVREQLSSVKEFLENSLFYKFRDDFTELLIRKLSTFPVKGLFSHPINFNELSLQKYDKGSIGITPHKDGKSLVNLICLFMITGKAEFALCADRSGANPRFLDTAPGNVILMRSPGFFSSNFQPFHFVRNITEERIVFGLRQK